jgi:feruloyl-CoA synthase
MNQPGQVNVPGERLRPVRLAKLHAQARVGPDGSIYVSSTEPLGDYPIRLTERLEHWANQVPDRAFMVQRSADGKDWQTLTYAEALARTRALAQAFIDRGLSPERPITILSGNDLDHACLALAAMHAGIPYAPISPAYALLASDFGRLRTILEALNPGLVFVADASLYQAALAATVGEETEIVSRTPCQLETPIDALYATVPRRDVDAAAAKVTPDTIAKYLFTSGSTGVPKAVINTQRMLCSNQQIIRQCFAFMQDEPPVLLDWSPWHHTAGGNHNFGLVLYNGGTFYIDDGKPTPNGIDRTVRNLREVAPTWYFTVPRGYEALLPHLRADEQLRKNFFSRVKMFYVAGAGLNQRVWSEFGQLARETCGERILFGSGMGATETGPFALVCMWEQEHANNCGVPGPGIELKLTPQDGKLEARLRSPSITPGYWKEAALTRKAFDEEGYYRLGDALRLADPDDVQRGFLFDGRLAENFKLASGTWVNVGAVRSSFVNHCLPYVQDAVITGLNEEYLGALVFPDLEHCRKLAEIEEGASPRSILGSPVVRRKFQDLLDSFAAQATGSSNRIERMILVDRPASLGAGEITDKGSLNQRVVLDKRGDLAALLYADPTNSVVIATAWRP